MTSFYSNICFAVAEKYSGKFAATLGELVAIPGNFAATPGELATISGELATISGEFAETPGELAETLGELAATPVKFAKYSVNNCFFNNSCYALINNSCLDCFTASQFAMTAAVIEPHRVIANCEAVKQSRINTVHLFTFA
jgi:hypothetical protein